MNIAYASKDIERKLTTDNGLIRAFGDNAIKILQRLEDIQSTQNLGKLKLTPIFKCRPFAHETGEWVITISSVYTLVVDLDHNPIPRLYDGSVDYASINCIRIKGIIRH
jgi:hypothetical protein